ncbi:MAG TPA: HAMP domain-containing protein, partial [Nannocystaceae bacterium]|nr:HAMP domain-containing protein [Nannocystaceae bacterium]
MSTAPQRPARRSSLFRRIWGTFVVTVLVAAVAVGTGAWLLARAMSNDWVTETMERLGEEHDQLVDVLDDAPALAQRLEALGSELGTHVSVYDIDGVRIAGDGPSDLPKRVHRRERELMRGRPVVQQRTRGLDRPIVLFPLTDPDDDELLAVVHVVGRPPPRLQVAIPMAISLLAALALGAAKLSRSLTTRLANLETSVGRIAKGELDHRVALPATPADELDELGDAVNEMA